MTIFMWLVVFYTFLEFQDTKAIRDNNITYRKKTLYSSYCAPLFDNYSEYRRCSSVLYEALKKCYRDDWDVECDCIIGMRELQISLGDMLSWSDIQRLDPPNWINTGLMDYAVRYVLDKKGRLLRSGGKYFYLPSRLGTSIFEGVYDRNSELDYVRLSDKVLIIPFIKEEHWLVAITDIPRKKMIYYQSEDPMLQEKPHKRDQAYADARIFLRVIRERNSIVADDDQIDVSGWTLSTPKFANKQYNTYDCGIYAMMFIEQILTENKWITRDTNKYRARLKHDILNGKEFSPTTYI